MTYAAPMRRLLALSFLILAPSLVRADVPPPEGYVESCTASNYGRGGRECRDCSTYHGNPPTFCADQMGAGFTIACRSRGASVWNEVWCRGDAAPAPAPAPVPTPAPNPTPSSPTANRGCTTSPTPSRGSLGFALVPLVLVLARRRLAR